MDKLRFCSYSKLHGNLAKEYSTDCGWGCTIRNFQTLLANALVRLDVDPKVFLDDKISSNIFSFNKLVKEAEKYGGRPGQHYATSVVLRSLIDTCHEAMPKKFPFDAHIVNSIAECDEVVNKYSQRPLIAFVQLRMGLYHPDVAQVTALKTCMKMPVFLGTVGGKSKSSYYMFAMTDDNKVIYLDPHILTTDNNTANYAVQNHQIGLDLKATDIDPNMTIAFLCVSCNDRQYLRDALKELDLYIVDLRFHDSLIQPVIRDGDGRSMFTTILDAKSVSDDEIDDFTILQ